MQIFVKYNRTLVYNVEPSDTIQSLRDKIFDIEGIPSKAYWLTCNGHILDPRRSFADHLVTKDSTIFINLRMHPRED